MYVSDYHVSVNSIETSAIRRISVDSNDETLGIVGPKEVTVQTEDSNSSSKNNGEVSTDPSLGIDQTIGNSDYTLDVPADPNLPLTFTDPLGGLLKIINVEGRAPGDVYTIRKENGSFVILRDGKILFTYLIPPTEIYNMPSDGYIGWYEFGTKNPITTPPEFVQPLPLNGYNYILQTTFTERMASTQSPFYYGNYTYGKGFLLFDDDTYVYDRALLDDDINRATYKIFGGRRYYYNDTEFLESPILPEWLVSLLAETPLRNNILEAEVEL
jgi:hypothetical protein